MRCPVLSELPPPRHEQIGWPWTEESNLVPENNQDHAPWPQVTVVTPSFNQGQFLEETIRSVLLQGYPNLEYFIFDGGSSDGSLEIIQRYSRWLSYWTSEPDNGQCDAINRGLQMGKGLFATWINSDDLLCKNALYNHSMNYGYSPGTVYLGMCVFIDAKGKTLFSHQGKIRTFEDLVDLRRIWRAKDRDQRGQIVQPEVLFPRSLAIECGGLNEDNHFTMDFELWGKMLLAGTRFEYTDVLFGMSRIHPGQKTRDRQRTTESLLRTARNLIVYSEIHTAKQRVEMMRRLDAYAVELKRKEKTVSKLFSRASLLSRRARQKIFKVLRRMLRQNAGG